MTSKFKCPVWFLFDVRGLARILDPNPSSRISIAKTMQNSWFTKGLDDKLLKNCKATREHDYSDVDVAFCSSGSNASRQNRRRENLLI